VTPDGTGHVTFAVGQWLFGDTDRDGQPDKANGWKQFGFDLDGQISNGNAESVAGLCMPRNGANPAIVHTDGCNGIDNSFGKLVLPILSGVSSTFPRTASEALSKGGQTLLLDLDKLGTGTDYFPLTARLYDGAPLGKAPARDGSDVWPVRADLLTDPTDVGSSKLQTVTSYLVGNTWVGRFHGDLPVKTIWDFLPLTLTVNDPLISMTLDPQHQTVTGGTIAGVLATDTFVAEAHYVGALWDPTLCSGPTLPSILAQITQASDILADGTQDPTKPCNGISIGLGFTAYRVQLGPVAPPEPPPPPDPCVDAGTGDAGTDGG
jgi:hypothetical protein